jgi:hypothetical protein
MAFAKIVAASGFFLNHNSGSINSNSDNAIFPLLSSKISTLA